MRHTRNVTYDKTYGLYPINNGYEQDFGCYTKTLDHIIEQTEYSCCNHSKVLTVRIDIRNPYRGNPIITRKEIPRIKEKLRRAIIRKYKNSINAIDITITWAEEGDANHPHYHFYICVNGNAIQNGYAIFECFKEVISGYSYHQGLVHYCNSNGKYGKMIHRNSSEFISQIRDAVYAGSYLAKTNTKENIPKGAHVSSPTRLPKNWKNSERYKEFQKLLSNDTVNHYQHSDDYGIYTHSKRDQCSIDTDEDGVEITTNYYKK